MNQGKAKKLKCDQNIRCMSSGRKCIMGCKTGHPLHLFPNNPSKRAEWFKILGISFKTKRIYLCGAHFPPNYTFGNKRNPHIFPTKPMEKQPNKQIPTVFHQQNQTSILDSSCTSDEQENQTSRLESRYTPDKQENQTSKDDSYTSDRQEIQRVYPEVYELRNPANRSLIATGRYYQKDDFLMTIYQQTNKLTHHQQIFLLNHKYEEQIKVLKHLKRENYRLTKAVRRHQILFSQLRKIQLKNVTIRKSIKKFKVKTKKLETRLKRQNIADNKKYLLDNYN